MRLRVSSAPGPGASFLDLHGKCSAMKLGANKRAGVGVAILVAAVVRIAEKAEGLAFGCLLSGRCGSEQAGLAAFLLRRAPRRPKRETTRPAKQRGQARRPGMFMCTVNRLLRVLDRASKGQGIRDAATGWPVVAVSG